MFIYINCKQQIYLGKYFSHLDGLSTKYELIWEKAKSPFFSNMNTGNVSEVASLKNVV